MDWSLGVEKLLQVLAIIPGKGISKRKRNGSTDIKRSVGHTVNSPITDPLTHPQPGLNHCKGTRTTQQKVRVQQVRTTTEPQKGVGRIDAKTDSRIRFSRIRFSYIYNP